MRYLKIKNKRGLVKDNKTGAILLTDRKTADDYLRQQQIFAKAHENINETKQLREELESMKEMLNKILEKDK